MRGRALAVLVFLALAACSRDRLPADWAAVGRPAGCSWIDGTYEAKGRAVDAAGGGIPLATALVPSLIDRVPVDYAELAKVEQVGLRWDAGAGVLHIVPAGGDMPAQAVAYGCGEGRLALRRAGPTVEKDWVGLGSEDIQVWQDAGGGLVVSASSRAVFAAFMLVPMAAGSSRYYRFERVTPAPSPAPPGMPAAGPGHRR
ncbi:hypothetical protein [Zavarzinia compransoris]|uniref:Lipoprotein n=1 Tax=Zavarzinia compransoris TaxID=1264899 RepID=A0A317E0X2_9PROT|nr:hypothetical protein [Zavarzinia compransoris]PWR19770.1 hypothetical protein DKG75_15020 [Zavarzinia compransoris]TDP45127.1 hypothetical protein DES42_106349 [Zavarzinia compransoris]